MQYLLGVIITISVIFCMIIIRLVFGFKRFQLVILLAGCINIGIIVAYEGVTHLLHWRLTSITPGPAGTNLAVAVSMFVIVIATLWAIASWVDRLQHEPLPWWIAPILSRLNNHASRR